MSAPIRTAIRPMQPCHLDAVIALERVCFPTPWSREMYAHELAANPYGSYWVMIPEAEAEDDCQDHVHDNHQDDGPDLPRLLAYGGIWVIGDELHVTTLASHPEWRRLGLGGQLLVYLLDLGRASGAKSATLEARMNNHPAIALYEKLGFVEVGVRKRYYADTGEDARLLTLFDLDQPDVWANILRVGQGFEAPLGHPR